ncbi:MAG: DNA-processing protein DprA [Planctomycetota bacterium]
MIELTARQAVRLALTDGVGPVTARKMLETFGSAEALFAAPADDLERVPGVGRTKARRFAAWPTDEEVDEELALAARHGARVVGFDDDEYPAHLRDIADAPLVLYVRGELTETDGLAVALVGSRRASVYGTKVAARLARQLAGLGMTVVSGMALGIDTAAHRGALEAGGRTVAVLGTGLAAIYPRENTELSDRIAGQGAVISEFPMRTTASPGDFPRRNRVVSGMTLGTVVVEAGKRSGALITARVAGEQGREVFAVPGKIDMPTFAGCHALIKDGARLVEDVSDIVAELGPMSREVDTGEDRVTTPQSLVLNEREQVVYQCLSSDPVSIDEIISGTGLPAPAVSSVLLILEVRKLVNQLPGKRFVRSQLMT